MIAFACIGEDEKLRENIEESEIQVDASDEVPPILIELHEQSAPKELPVRTMRTFPVPGNGRIVETLHRNEESPEE